MSKFAPVGTRGCGSPFTHHIFGVSEGEYEVQCNDNLLVIVQIESKSGVENVEEIAAVPGVDVLFVGESPVSTFSPHDDQSSLVFCMTGPFDLAKSMNIEFGSQAHEDAIARTLTACKANNKFASIFCMFHFPPTFPCTF